MDRLTEFLVHLRTLLRRGAGNPPRETERTSFRYDSGPSLNTAEADRRRHVHAANRPRCLSGMLLASLSVSTLLTGCSTTEKKTVGDLQYLDGEKSVSHYRGYGTAIEHPCIDNVTSRAVQLSGEPRSLQRRLPTGRAPFETMPVSLISYSMEPSW